MNDKFSGLSMLEFSSTFIKIPSFINAVFSEVNPSSSIWENLDKLSFISWFIFGLPNASENFVTVIPFSKFFILDISVWRAPLMNVKLIQESSDIMRFL